MTQTETLPLFPLATVLFPGALLPLHIFEERYRRLMRDRREADPIFGVVLTRTGREVGDEPEVHELGTAASLVGARRYVDGTYDVVVRGAARFRVLDGDWSRGYLVATVEWLREEIGERAEAETLTLQVRRAYDRFLDAIARAIDAERSEETWPDDPSEFAYDVCARLPLDNKERQRLLEAATTVERLGDLERVLARERALLIEAGAAGRAITYPGLGFSPN
jgi:Lon protease-like protein